MLARERQEQILGSCPHCDSYIRANARFCHVCGRKQPDLKAGDQIGNYIVERLLGVGGIGAVYLSHHRLLKQRAALKIHDYFPEDIYSLGLDEEIRGIDLALRQAEFRDRFEIRQQWAVRFSELQGHLLRHKPDIVHFSGHGSTSSEIILEDINGASHLVPPRALSQLFSVLKDNIRCVVLNACYSKQQAQAIAQHIDCVIGMSKAIGDIAAIDFAVSFYQALGYGRNVKTAFDLGCSQIDLDSLGEQNTPKLLAPSCDPASIVFTSDV